MHDEFAIRAVFQGLSGVLIMGLGAFVLSVRPRTLATKAFAAFALGFGFNFVVFNAFWLVHADEPAAFIALRVAGRVVVLVAVAAMAWTFPRPLAREERTLLVPAGVAGAALLAGLIVNIFTDPTDLAPAYRIPTRAATSVLYAYILLLVLRLARSRDADARRQFALTAAGPLLYEAYGLGFSLMGVAGGDTATIGLVVQLAILSTCVVIALATSWGPVPNAGRNLALASLGAALLGMITGPLSPDWANVGGLFRILMVAILAYAILRHQLLGIDVKVRFAISKSTIAAVFIAVFFIASETAQQFFGDTLGSTYVGIAAAGALVFAMAPLQRVAERLAEKAVPLAPVPRAHDEPSRNEDAFRRALRVASRDRRLTRADEVEFAHLADTLGITAGRAATILHEVEREAEVG